MTGQILLVIRFVLAVVLYLFFGYAIYILWRDIKNQQTLSASRLSPTLSLTIQMDETTHVQKITLPEITIGRDPACECTLPSETVSARHARLSYHHGQWWIEDLGSKNGTYLNQELISETSVVANGDRLQCGNVVLTISLD